MSEILLDSSVYDFSVDHTAFSKNVISIHEFLMKNNTNE